MQELILPSFSSELPSSLHRVPKSLQKYHQSITTFNLIEPVDKYTQLNDQDIQTIYYEANKYNKVGLIVQEYAPYCVVRPDLYIPLILSSYKDLTLTELLVQHDPFIRGQIITGAIKERALLETAQAHFELGISGLNELPQSERNEELKNLTTQISFIHNLHIELLSD